MKHDISYINDYDLSSEKLETLKDKYVRHLYTKEILFQLKKYLNINSKE